MEVIKKVNYYVAEMRGTAMYSGIAETPAEFIALCEEEGYDLEGCEIIEIHHNLRPQFGRRPQKGVNKDLGTI